MAAGTVAQRAVLTERVRGLRPRVGVEEHATRNLEDPVTLEGSDALVLRRERIGVPSVERRAGSRV